jgi:ribosomal protein L25 (general stress protein Ctc)
MTRTFTSPAIAKEMARIYGNRTEHVNIELRHERAIKKYVFEIEDARKKPTVSKCKFR